MLNFIWSIANIALWIGIIYMITRIIKQRKKLR